MIPLAAVIGASTAIGVGAEHRFRGTAEAVARRLMTALLWVLLPPIVFVNIASLQVTPEVGAGIGFAWLALAATVALAYAAGTWVLRLSRPQVGALMIAAALANTGFLGLPFNVALLGVGELPNAVAYDILVSSVALVTVGFSIGAGFGVRASGARDRTKVFFTRNPALWATAAGFVAPASLAPAWAVDASQVVVLAIVPIGFFVVGVTLAAEAEQGALRFPPPLEPPVAVAVGLKLVLPPAILAALAAVVVDVPQAYLVQSGMATAINSIVVANEYGLDRRLCAAAIVWTTAIVVAVGLALAAV